VTRSPTRRRLLVDALAGAGALNLASSVACATPRRGAAPGPTDPAGAALPTGDVHDFDFFVGEWKGANRRLKKRWVGSDDWEEFPGYHRCESRMGGVVNLTDVAFPTKGWSGMTVRTFDLEKRQWHLYWINSKTGRLFPPLIGGFTGDRGEFYGHDTDDGRPVHVRYVWTRPSPDIARWEQAFSLDGRLWEINWTVEKTRVKPVTAAGLGAART
jgi:hypothetical protein